jgi:flagellar basal-body rod protein FlgF
MDITSALAASRMMAQQRAMDVTANNLANTNTPGYRNERVQFSDWIDRQTGTTATKGIHSISYMQDRATWRETQAGTLTHTGNPYDLALSSDGYFTVSTKNGPRLTRDGRFGLGANGTLMDSAGNAVLDTNGKPIQIPSTSTQVSISGDGTISSEDGQLGKIGVVKPADPMTLKAEGATNFVTEKPTTPLTNPGIVQGATEDSNVQPVLEVTRMIDTQRQFQFASQIVQAESDRQRNLIDKLLPGNQ